MGYEVLDSRDESALSPADDRLVGRGPVVVELTIPTEPGRPRQAGGRRTALVVAFSLLAGALVGAALSRRHESLAAQAKDRARVAVSAQATDVSPFAQQIGVGARLQVKVSNLGPLPVQVMDTATFGGPPGTRAPMVTMLGGASSVAPGRSALVEMRVSIDCRPGRPLAARLPVRTADGAEHRVDVTVPDDATALCPRVVAPSILVSSLTGSVLRPALQLWNNTDKPLRVSFLPMGLLPASANTVIKVVASPALPRTIGPREELTVRLRFIARSCVAELQDLRTLENTHLSLASELLTPGTVIPAGQVDVDLTAIVAATMVRACG